MSGMITRLRTLFSKFFALALFTAFLVGANGWEDRSPLLSSSLFLAGAVLAGIAAIGRTWCTLYIAGYKREHLITVGPYSVTRNPLYFFSMLGSVGVALATETLSIPLIIIVAFALYYPAVIRREESRLREFHQGAFEEYFARVPRFFPRWSLFTEPEDYVVKPIVFRRHIMSALWFVWMLGIVEFIECLHEAGLLPTWFHIY